MFTRAVYEAVATVLSKYRFKVSARRTGHRKVGSAYLTALFVIDELTEEFAALFEGDNERFDRKRFYKAAGWTTNPVPVFDRLKELEHMAKVAIDKD